MSESTEFDKAEPLLKNLELREIQECNVFESNAEEVLSKLSINPTSLSLRSREILSTLKKYQDVTGVKRIDKASFLTWYSQLALNHVDKDYEVLKLKQKNEELDFEIEHLNRDISKLNADLEESKNRLCNQQINPGNITSEISLVSKKLLSYEQNYEKTKQNFTKLNVPLDIYPKSLQILIDQLSSLKAEELDLKDRAENIMLARSAKENLLKLKGNKF